jgi:hypothetical protein
MMTLETPAPIRSGRFRVCGATTGETAMGVIQDWKALRRSWRIYHSDPFLSG